MQTAGMFKDIIESYKKKIPLPEFGHGSKHKDETSDSNDTPFQIKEEGQKTYGSFDKKY